MSVIRCPQCLMPLTDDETRTGICPICAAALTSGAPAPAHPAPAPARSRIGPLVALGAVALVLVAVGVYVVYPPPLDENPLQAGNNRKSDGTANDKKEPITIPPEKIPTPKNGSPEETTPLSPEIIHAPTVRVSEPVKLPVVEVKPPLEKIPGPKVVVVDPVNPPVVVVRPPLEKIPGPKVVVVEKKEKVKEKDKQPPVTVNGEVLVGVTRKLNRPEGPYDLGVLNGHNKKLDLSGKVKTLHVAQVVNGFALTIANLEANHLNFGRIEGHGTKIKLSGKVKKLTIGSMVTGAVLDATQLEAEEIVFTGRMEGWTKVKLNGKVKKLRLDQINVGATLEVLQLDAQEISFGHRLDGHVKVTLSGKVKTLRVQEVTTGASLDAGQLAAQEIIFSKRMDGHARVKVSAPGGVVEFRDRVDGGAHLDINAPGGKVTFTEPSDKGKVGSKIDGDARVTVTAKEAEFRGIINGNNTRVIVTLTESGTLRFREIAGNIRLQYRKAQANHPDPVVEAGIVRGKAKVEKIQ